MAMSEWPRHNVRRRTVGGGRVEVYERDDRLGQGVCMSLYAGGVEVMRFDLFDPPHEHWGVGEKPRMYYPPSFDRFELAVWHLRHYSRFVADVVVSDADAAWARNELLSRVDLSLEGL